MDGLFDRFLGGADEPAPEEIQESGECLVCGRDFLEFDGDLGDGICADCAPDSLTED